MYEAETEGIVVRAAPCYLPQESDPESGRWLWAYTIQIENRSPRTVQLLTRHWRIVEETGVEHRVDGDGVVGRQPVLRPGETHQYTSACPLSCPSGMMGGAYGMIDVETKRPFRATVPTFALDSPDAGDRKAH
jgi:ApaG protein